MVHETLNDVGMNKNTTIAIVILLFGAAGGMYYWRSGGVNDLTSQRNYNASLHCLSCNQDFLAELDVADAPPINCSKCGKKTGWYKWECGSCGEKFTPAPGGDPPRQPVAPPCPKCKGSMTGRMAGPT